MEVTVIRERVEKCADAIFGRLDQNDVLFVDSTHMIRPQGDVLHEVLHLFGALRSGVFIHVHDIFTPRDYPREWVLERRLLWNEQYLLEAFLCFNSSFKIMCASNYLAHDHKDEFWAAFPQVVANAEPGSIWIKKVSRTEPKILP